MHADIIGNLQNDWPGWKIWRTATMWNATRRGPLPDVPTDFFSRRGHLLLTLLEDGPDELVDALRNQDAIEAAAEAASASDHSGEHPINPACPIRCLGLQQGTEDTLTVHWRGEGEHAPTIGDLLALRQDRALTSVFGISWGRAGEIDRKLEALGLETRS